MATGDLLAGEVWHRSPFQVGLTVDDFGDGLLVVADQAPGGGGYVVVTTYGLADDRFGQLEKSWTQWWDTAFTGQSDDG